MTGQPQGSGMVHAFLSRGLGPAMREAWLFLQDARIAAEAETDPDRKAMIEALIRDVEGRIAPVSVAYAQSCLRLMGPVLTEKGCDLRDFFSPDDEPALSRVGLLFAEASVARDPRIHGENFALEAMRAVVAREATDPVAC